MRSALVTGPTTCGSWLCLQDLVEEAMSEQFIKCWCVKCNAVSLRPVANGRSPPQEVCFAQRSLSDRCLLAT